jgi:hypothetical protein
MLKKGFRGRVYSKFPRADSRKPAVLMKKRLYLNQDKG